MTKSKKQPRRHANSKQRRKAPLAYDPAVGGWVRDPALMAGPPGQRAGNAVSRRLWMEADKLFRADNRLEFVTLRVSAADALEMLKVGALLDVLDPPFSASLNALEPPSGPQRWADQWAILSRDKHFESYKKHKMYADTRTALLVKVSPDREPPAGDFARTLWTAMEQAHELGLFLREYLDTIPEAGLALTLYPSSDTLGWVLQPGRAAKPAGSTRPIVRPVEPGDPHHGRYAAVAIWR